MSSFKDVHKRSLIQGGTSTPNLAIRGSASGVSNNGGFTTVGMNDSVVTVGNDVGDTTVNGSTVVLGNNSTLLTVGNPNCTTMLIGTIVPAESGLDLSKGLIQIGTISTTGINVGNQNVVTEVRNLQSPDMVRASGGLRAPTVDSDALLTVGATSTGLTLGNPFQATTISGNNLAVTAPLLTADTISANAFESSGVVSVGARSSMGVEIGNASVGTRITHLTTDGSALYAENGVRTHVIDSKIDLAVGSTQSGSLNIGTATHRNSAINVGTGTESTAHINVGSANTTTTIYGSTTTAELSVNGSLTASSVKTSTIDSAGILNVGSFTKGAVNVGADVGRTTDINIGTGATYLSSINIGSINSTTSLKGNVVAPSGFSTDSIEPVTSRNTITIAETAGYIFLGGLDSTVVINGRLETANAPTGSTPTSTDTPLPDLMASATFISSGDIETRNSQFLIGVQGVNQAIKIGNATSTIYLGKGANVAAVIVDSSGVVVEEALTAPVLKSFSIDPISSSEELDIAPLQTSGILNIGNHPSRTGAINLGSSGSTLSINGTLTANGTTGSVGTVLTQSLNGPTWAEPSTKFPTRDQNTTTDDAATCAFVKTAISNAKTVTDTSIYQAVANLKISNTTWSGENRFKTPALSDASTLVATTAYVFNAINLLKSGATWTGTHLFPVPTVGSTSNAAATAGFVTTAVSNMVTTIKAAANTWIGDNRFNTPGLSENSTLVATTAYVVNAINLLKSGATWTGTHLFPVPAVGSTSNAAATAGFVTTAVSNMATTLKAAVNTWTNNNYFITQGVGNDSTLAATTAFVASALTNFISVAKTFSALITFSSGIKTDTISAIGSSLNVGTTTTGTFVNIGATGSTVNIGGVVKLNEITLVSMLPPVGSIISYSGLSSPSGWLLCDGMSYSTTTYASLFSIIAYRYGGSGTSFCVPDLKNQFLRGASTTSTLSSSKLGAESVTISTNQLPSHTHTVREHTHVVYDHQHMMEPHDHGAAPHVHFYADVAFMEAGGSNTAEGGSIGSNKSDWDNKAWWRHPDGSVNAGIQFIATSETTVDVYPNTAYSTNPGGGGRTAPQALTTQETGAGAALTILPPYVSINYIIKC